MKRTYMTRHCKSKPMQTLDSVVTEDGHAINLFVAVEDPETVKGNILLIHGIKSDRHEGGVFDLFAEKLIQIGFRTFRFDFRGHGQSPIPQIEMTVKGEIIDIKTVLNHIEAVYSAPLGILAASFGAAATLCGIAGYHSLKTIVLWNPTLDLDKTLINALTDWGRGFLTPQSTAQFKEKGYIDFDGYRFGPQLIEELKTFSVLSQAGPIGVPVLTIHGDDDHYAPYSVALAHYQFNDHCRFITIEGSDHGFGKPDDLAFVFDETLKWITRLVP